ncbi:unnamed protein product [marine sediment metagenome]|uniref:Uncharacterized protein n=1 Tax=marine sediment metagenome TaxID=412755 RepID=X1LWV4_9ZZZZ
MEERRQIHIPGFDIEYYWHPEGLVIECPSAAARDFIARTIEEKPMVVKVKEKHSMKG